MLRSLSSDGSTPGSAPNWLGGPEQVTLLSRFPFLERGNQKQPPWATMEAKAVHGCRLPASGSVCT